MDKSAKRYNLQNIKGSLTIIADTEQATQRPTHRSMRRSNIPSDSESDEEPLFRFRYCRNASLRSCREKLISNRRHAIADTTSDKPSKSTSSHNRNSIDIRRHRIHHSYNQLETVIDPFKNILLYGAEVLHLPFVQQTPTLR